jgi:hypothetical protein
VALPFSTSWDNSFATICILSLAMVAERRYKIDVDAETKELQMQMSPMADTVKAQNARRVEAQTKAQETASRFPKAAVTENKVRMRFVVRWTDQVTKERKMTSFAF